MTRTTPQIHELQALLEQHHLDYYLVPGTDPHQTEYIAPNWQRRAFISGFTGSNGDVMIGRNKSYLWTDGRYSLQAKLELDPALFQVFEYQQGQASTISRFFREQIKNQRVGVDPMTLSIGQAENLRAILAENRSELIFTPENLVDSVWPNRPACRHMPALVYPLNFAGLDTGSKLAQLRAFMLEEELDFLALNELTGIAWLFNIRGHDLEMTPVLFCYALISHDDATLYLDPASITPELQAYLYTLHIKLLPYTEFYADLATINARKVGVDQYANAMMYEALKHNKRKLVNSPITLAKACKNNIELEGMIKAHEEDAKALCRFFSWLERNWQQQTEVSIAKQLLEFRRQSPLFFSPSFETIAGFKDHGAIIHYHAHPETAYTLDDKALLLIDSGGQYLGGTTDVTRTIHLGTPTAFERECYTLVLKGHLTLGHTFFPAGTRGEQLDALARQYLWQKGCNYAHGTGHGVGAFLNVHEGPHRIATGTTTVPLLPNMITSNEPGVYLEGQFGIRIENLCYVAEANINSRTNTQFYTLADLTLVPYCRKLIDVKLLSTEEIAWINAYHQEIFMRLKDHLDAETKAWLEAATAPLPAA